MFKKAKWIWNTDAGGTDAYAEFLTECEFEEHDSVKLRISADSNYAVYLNGGFVDSGQYADYPYYKVYDEIDLSRFVVSGTNHIAFIVWYYGVSSSNYYTGNPGLLFEIERNGEIVLSSDETVRSRKSRQYISGRNEKITPQLGLNFHIDMKESDNWMTGSKTQDFGTSVAAAGMPENLFPREIKKLLVKPRIPADIIAQGTFFYPDAGLNSGAKMQSAAMTFYRLDEMRLENPREMNRNNPGEPKQQNPEANPLTISRHTEDGIYFIIDLKAESTGYLDFDLEVFEDCESEIGWGEHLEDLRCRTSVGNRNFSVTVSLKKGRNCYMNPFRRLGCRYIQFFLHTDTVKIHYAGLRPVVYPVKAKEYKSGNLLRDRIYAVCQHTLLQCMHEHYEDCPWREQSMYTLDSRNQMLCGYYAFGEYEFPRACLLLIAKGVREDGCLPICFPTKEKLSIPSFSLFYIMQLEEYYRYSKDAKTIKDCYGSARKIVDAHINRIDETGLIPNFDEAGAFWNFYEWQPGLEGYGYKGKKAYDMCLNAILSLILESFAELCTVVGVDTQPYLLKKEELNRRIAEKFHDRETGLFRTCIGHEVPYSVLANALGYLCGAAEGLDHSNMMEIIQKNGKEAPGPEVIPATLSMYTFRYEALLKENKELYKNDVLEEIDRSYLEMLMKGATSFWETAKGEKDFDFAGSLCHGWSAMPIYYYEVLCGD